MGVYSVGPSARNIYVRNTLSKAETIALHQPKIEHRGYHVWYQVGFFVASDRCRLCGASNQPPEVIASVHMWIAKAWVLVPMLWGYLVHRGCCADKIELIKMVTATVVARNSRSRMFATIVNLSAFVGG